MDKTLVCGTGTPGSIPGGSTKKGSAKADFLNHLSLWYSDCMQRLGIDYGSKKIGLALSDESGTLAFPHSVIPNDAEIVIAESHDV